MNTDTYKDELIILEQLEIELDPRMTEQERWEAGVLCGQAKRLRADSIKDYFRYLNRLAHAKGLIMKDREVLPGVVKNTY